MVQMAGGLEDVVVSGLCHSFFRVVFIKGGGGVCCTHLWLGCYRLADAIPTNSLQMENAAFLSSHLCQASVCRGFVAACGESLL